MSKSSSESGSSFSRAGLPILIVGAIAIALATLMPSDQPETTESLCLVCGEVGGVDVLLNVLLLLPLGTGLALMRTRRAVAIPSVFMLTVCIELLQRYVIPGRDGSIGDVITNTTGGVVGYIIGVHIEQLVTPTPATAAWLTAAAMSVWMAAHWVGSYALMPSPTDSRYFGQLARELGNDPPYAGTIQSATLAGWPIPDWEITDRARVAGWLRAPQGASLDVTVVPHELPRHVAAIARIADAQEEEIVLLAASHEDLIFAVRTRASDLSLRRPYYRMRGGHPGAPDVPGSALTPMHLHGRYAPPQVEMRAERGPWRLASTIRLSSSQGWRLFALASVTVEGSRLDKFLDAVWLLLILSPAGYWACFFIRGARTRARAVPGVMVLLILVAAGFAIGPTFFALSEPSPLEIVAALSGLVAGAGLAVVVSRYFAAPEAAAR